MTTEPKMTEYLNIGPTPAAEPCADIRDPGYYEKSKAECQRFIELIRKVCGAEPPGAELRTKTFEHEYGTYREVVCKFDPDDEAATEYAFKVEAEAPERWEP